MTNEKFTRKLLLQISLAIHNVLNGIENNTRKLAMRNNKILFPKTKSNSVDLQKDKNNSVRRP